MGDIAITSVDLARVQFATTSLYRFLFVPLTLSELLITHRSEGLDLVDDVVALDDLACVRQRA